MTNPEGRRKRAQPIRLELRRRDAGTLLGALAWVMGALQIMRDRAHAEGEHGGTEYDQIYQELTPRLERIVAQVVSARQATVTSPEFEEGLEEAFQDVRRAFEEWIRLTAIDTFGAAVASHLDEIEELSGDEEDGAEDQGEPGR